MVRPGNRAPIVGAGFNQDASKKLVRIPAPSAALQHTNRLEEPPQELRRLMAVDRNVLPSKYWIVGHGWDLVRIRSDLNSMFSSQRHLQVATEHFDSEGRLYDKETVVVNFVDVASSYGLRFLKDVDDHDDNKVHWEGVRLCLKYIKGRLRLKVIGIIFQHWRAYDGPLEQLRILRDVPQDVSQVCEFIEETPNLTLSQHRHANDEMTIKLAYRRNCRILDNDDYAGWMGVGRGLRNEKIRKWLEQSQEFLHMNYKFIWDGLFCDFEMCSFTRRNVSRSGGLGDIGTAEVNKLREGWTPLCTAAKAGDVELVQRLLKHGANPNVPNCEGVYPVYFAALECNVPMVEALKESGADLSLIPRPKFEGLIGNVHWRLGKRRSTLQRRRLLVLLGMDANSRDPMAVSSNTGVGSSNGAVGSSAMPSAIAPARRTRERRERGDVVRVHSSPPRKIRRSHRAKPKHRTLGLHPKCPYRRLIALGTGHKRKKKEKATPIRGNIDLEEIDLTQEVDPPLRRRRRPEGRKELCSKETEAVYLKVMRTSGPDAAPLIAMVDPYNCNG